MKYIICTLLVLCIYLAPAQPAWSAGQDLQPPATAVAPHSIPFKAEPQSLGSQLGQSLLVLVIVIGLAAGGLYAARKYMPRLGLRDARDQRLKLLEVMRLTPRTTLFVVRFDDKTLLLSQHGEALKVLDTVANDSPSSNSPTVQ